MPTSANPAPVLPVAAPAATPRRALWTVVGVALSATIVLLAVRVLDVQAILAHIRAVSLAAVAAAVGLRLLLLAFQAERWRVLLPPDPADGTKPPRRRLLLYHLAAGAANWLAPLRPSEALRVGAVARNEGIAWPSAAGAQGVEKVHEAIGLLALAAPLALGSLGARTPWLRAAAAILAGLLGAVLLAGVTISRGPLTARVRRFAGDRLARGAGSLRDAGRTFTAVALTLLAYASEGAMVLVIAHAVGLQVRFAVAALVLLALNATLLLPSAPGQLGTFEAAIVLGLAPLGAPRATAVGMALVLHGCHAIADLAGGATAVMLLPLLGRRTRAAATTGETA